MVVQMLKKLGRITHNAVGHCVIQEDRSRVTLVKKLDALLSIL